MNKIFILLAALFVVTPSISSFGLNNTKELIEVLVNTGKSHDYNEVVSAYKQLRSGDKNTFLELLENINDPRESYNYFAREKIYPDEHIISVGEVCYDIIITYLEGETPKMVASFGSLPQQEVLTFIEKNKNLDLINIQIKAVEYIINKLKTENKNEFIPYWQDRLEKLKNKLITN